MSFMGLLPEIDHAWMTVDNVLFLWNYHTQDFTQYRQLEQVRESACGFLRGCLGRGHRGVVAFRLEFDRTKREICVYEAVEEQR